VPAWARARLTWPARLGDKTDTRNRSDIIVCVKSQLIRNGFDAERVTEEMRAARFDAACALGDQWCRDCTRRGSDRAKLAIRAEAARP